MVIAPGVASVPGVAIVPDVPFGPIGLATGPGRVDATGLIDGRALGFGLAQLLFCSVLATMLLLADGDGHGDAASLVDCVPGAVGVCALAVTPTAPARTNAPAMTAPPNHFGCFISTGLPALAAPLTQAPHGR